MAFDASHSRAYSAAVARVARLWFVIIIIGISIIISILVLVLVLVLVLIYTQRLQ